MYQAGQEAQIAVDVGNQSSVDIENFAVKVPLLMYLEVIDCVQWVPVCS